MNYSLEDYLTLEASSSVKHEFLDGQIYGMAGGTPEHAALKAAITGLLFAQLRGSTCRPYDADLRVRVQHTGLLTYPDVTIVCGPLERDAQDGNAILNPTLLIEVTSPNSEEYSTEEYDRGDKFEHYQRIASLREYLPVSHSERALESWHRNADGTWTRVVASSGETVKLRSLGTSLAVNDVYDAAGVL